MNKYFGIRLPQELAERVEKEAAERLTNKSSIIRHALVLYFTDKQGEKAAEPVKVNFDESREKALEGLKVFDD